MLTILKAVLRFIKFSKLSFIGLFFLVFFSSLTFNTLNNLTLNLSNSLKNISNEGNLHDFVINENYKKSNVVFSLKKIIYLNNENFIQENGNINAKIVYNNNFKTNEILFELDKTTIKNGELAWDEASFFVYDLFEKNKLSKDDHEKFLNFLKFKLNLTTTDQINFKADSDFLKKIKSLLTTQSNNLNKFINEIYQKNYLKILKENNLKVRKFNSININNTNQNVFFKLVESNPSYEINKLVIFDGHNLTKSRKKFFENFNSFNKEDFINNKSLSRNLIPFLARAKWSNNNNFSELNNFILKNKNFNPYEFNEKIIKDKKIIDQLEIVKKIIDQKGIIDKGYSVNFIYNDGVPVSGFIEDFNSYQIVISPNYFKKLNKKPIELKLWEKHINDTQSDFISWIKSLPEENIILIDKQEFVVFGSGISPDFMYPVLSFQNIVPNQEKEQVAFTTVSGLEKLIDSFKLNETENFLVGKFDKNKKNWKKQLENINNISLRYMSWPSNIKAAYLYNDLSNIFTPSALRVQFIPNIIKIISNASYFLTIFIILLSLVICIVVIQKFIEFNKNNLGVMQANGYSKFEIIFGISVLISIPIIFSTINGYIIGFLFQPQAIKILNNFWTLPTQISPFSFLILGSLVFLILLLFLIVTILFCLHLLKGETSEFMKDDSKYKPGILFKFIKLFVKKINIISKLRIFVAFSSISKLLLLSLMSTLFITALNFSLNIIYSFKNSIVKTYENKNYNYELDLITPTLQSGQYYAVPYNRQGSTLNKKIYFNNQDTLISSNNNVFEIPESNWVSQQYFNNKSFEKYKIENSKNYNSLFIENLKKFGNYQIISLNDQSNSKKDIFYLKNKSVNKAFVDLELGVGSLSANAWKLASQLLPPNNVNYINDAFKNLFSNATLNKNNKKKFNFSNLINNEKNYYDWIRTFFSSLAIRKKNSNKTPKKISFKDNSSNNLSNNELEETKIINEQEIKNYDFIFLNKNESAQDEFFNYYFILNNNKVVDIADISPAYLNLLYQLNSDEELDDYSYSINFGKLILNYSKSNNKIFDSPYTYIDFKINELNHKPIKIEKNFKSISLNKNSKNIDLVNENNKKINSKINDAKIKQKLINNEMHFVYPIIVNSFVKRVYNIKKNDLIKIEILNSADRFSRKHFDKKNPIAFFEVIDITSTFNGPEFYTNQFDANKILGLTINNIKPTTPKSKQEIKDWIEWNTLEYDFKEDNNDLNLEKKEIFEIVNNISRENFDISKSGFNGLFSKSPLDLKQVTGGLSLYSLSGIYLAVDKFSPNDKLLNEILDNDDNLKKIIAKIGFLDLVHDKKLVIDEITKIFGESSVFSIITNAKSRNTIINVFSVLDTSLTTIQNIVLFSIISITILIIGIISSIIIRDSIKPASILKSLGMPDRINISTFLSIYFFVFFIGIILSIPLSIFITFIYSKVILELTGMILSFNLVWWHYFVTLISIFLLFSISYWTAWSKISDVNLPDSIK